MLCKTVYNSIRYTLTFSLHFCAIFRATSQLTERLDEAGLRLLNAMSWLKSSQMTEGIICISFGKPVPALKRLDFLRNLRGKKGSPKHSVCLSDALRRNMYENAVFAFR